MGNARRWATEKSLSRARLRSRAARSVVDGVGVRARPARFDEGMNSHVRQNEDAPADASYHAPIQMPQCSIRHRHSTRRCEVPNARLTVVVYFLILTHLIKNHQKSRVYPNVFNVFTRKRVSPRTSLDYDSSHQDMRRAGEFFNRRARVLVIIPSIFVLILLLFCREWRPSHCRRHAQVHVALFADKNREQMNAALTVMNSILHSTPKSRVEFHLFTPSTAAILAEAMLSCYFDGKANVHLHPLKPALIPRSEPIGSKSDVRLANPMNFARFQLPELLPDVSKVLYVDTDVLITSDLTKLFTKHLCRISRTSIAVVNRQKRISTVLDFDHPLIAKLRIDPQSGSFNAGLMLINLDSWRRYKTSQTILHWVRLNREANIYAHGTQPPLHLTFDPSLRETIDRAWNVDGLGWRLLTISELQRAHSLHWTGPKKPWTKGGLYKELWQLYEIGSCKKLNISDEFGHK